MEVLKGIKRQTKLIMIKAYTTICMLHVAIDPTTNQLKNGNLKTKNTITKVQNVTIIE